MKQQTTLILIGFALLFGTVIFSGSAGGVALVQQLDRTGGPTGMEYCNACHVGNNLYPSLDIKMLQNGNPISAYVPGQTYTLQVVVLVNDTIEASTFGFQAVALIGTDTIQAGIFKNPASGIAIRTLNNRSYPEHIFPSLKDTFSVEWEAPVATTGEVRFYAAGVASNANNDFTGDGAAKSELFLQEDTGASVLFPNPSELMTSYFTGSTLQVEMPDREGLLMIWDINGRLILQQQVNSGGITVPFEGKSAGVYILTWSDQNTRLSHKIVLP